MKIIPLAMLCMITFSIQSCKTTKETNKEMIEENKIEKKVSINFEKDGYSKAKVIFDSEKSAPCNYLIKLEKGELLEPLTYKYDALKTNNEKVWIKFARQRRLGSCNGAQPVEILNIEKRTE